MDVTASHTAELIKRLTVSLRDLVLEYDCIIQEDNKAYDQMQRGYLDYRDYYQNSLCTTIAVKDRIRTIADLLDIDVNDILDALE